jgi:predicted  nucleic acid-binding Zn-ribbon protein
MMNSVREGDAAAKFLRTMLQMNPAYGTYLQSDQDLMEVVALFSKRIKTKISQFDAPSNIPPHVLNQPLCEMLWRVVGIVMHSVIELEEEANMPVPKEASGMIRMLLHTNTALSTKLNDLRRVYLKELSEHRDKQRRITKVAQGAINTLEEQPIMFYEPLEFVLDDTTKDFVREAVVERIKLEMRTAFQKDGDNEEVTRYIEELETQVENLKTELKTCRASNNRLEEQLKTITEREQKQREDLKAFRKSDEEKTKQIDELEKAMKKMESEMANKDRRIAHLEAKLGEAPSAPTQVITSTGTDNHAEEMEALSSKVADLESENKNLKDENDKLKKKLAELEAKMRAAAGPEDRVVYQDDPETKKLLEQALQVEKELRAANEALQRALEEAEKENADLRKELGKKPAPAKEKPVAVTPTKTKKDGPSAEEMAAKDAEHDKALKKLTAAHDKKIQEMQDLIDKLKKQLEEAKAKIDDLEEALAGEPKAGKTKVVKQVGVPEEEHTKLKIKCHELEQLVEKMTDEYALLEQKVQMLMDKLKEKFSDAELGEILEKIALAPPPIKKRRKKKAYERLYDDAQRRILEMKMRQEKLKQLEEKSLRNMARIVAGSRDARKVDILNHLHQAKEQTSQRFHDALANFTMSRTHTGELTGLEDDYDSDEEVSRRIDRLTDLEEMTLQCFKDGVCPRCAFSALKTFSTRRTSPNAGGGLQKMGHGLTFAGTNANTFGTPWSPGRGRQGSPSDIGAPPWARSGGSRGSSGSPKRGESPLGSGPQPGRMPFDSEYPMPSPPWRQPVVAEPSAPPWRDLAASGGNASVSSTVPASQGGFFGGRDASDTPSNRFAESTVSAAVVRSNSDDKLPPWRRARSGSPVNADVKNRSPSPKMSMPVREFGIIAQPPSGMAPSLQQRGMPQPGGGMTPSMGRLGRPPGPDWLPAAPVPGRIPAAQTMPLDPIVRPGSGNDPSSKPLVNRPLLGQAQRSLVPASSSSSRSPSPHVGGGQKVMSDGFKKMRAASDFLGGGQMEVDGQGRPSSVPSFMVNQSASQGSFPAGVTTTMGGGGVGTQYKNIGTKQLPTVPSTRSTPTLPVAGNRASMPWNQPEVPWQAPPPANNLGSKASKKPGLAFAVESRPLAGNVLGPQPK